MSSSPMSLFGGSLIDVDRTYGLRVSPFALLLAFAVPIRYGLSLVVAVFTYSIMIDMWFDLGTFEKSDDCACEEADDVDDLEGNKVVADDTQVPALERC